ncbi:MAG: hypothetical protein GY841_18275 [FCB group bacterium]|nr:hypothetical protein [FCB group bacterium]
MELRLPDRIKFMLLGAGNQARFTLTKLPSVFKSSCLISNGEWDKSWSAASDETIFDIAQNLGIVSVDAGSYNEVIEFIQREKPNVCLTVGSKWIFKADFLDHFEGRVFNYHPSNLPRHRGGGVYSWQILNDATDACVSIHQMVDKVDAGPIALQRNQFVSYRPTPEVFGRVCEELAQETIVEFLEVLNDHQGKHIELTDQDEKQSSYFPLLKSAVNGAIDFNWEIDDLEKFIRAFSYPYPGAFTVYRKKTIHILEADILDREHFHPFCYGLVIAVLDNGDVRLACRGGSLRVRRVKHDEKFYSPADILKTGYRMWTPIEALDKSRRYRPRP